MQSELIEIEEFDKIFFKYSERFIEDFKKCVILYIDGLTVEPSTDALKYYEQLTTELDSKDPDDHILDTNVELAIGEPKYYIDHAYMHYRQSQELYQNKYWNKSWSKLLEAFYKLGAARGVFEERYLFADKVHEHELIGHSKYSAAGKAKAKLLNPIKKRVIELLYQHQPEGGWISKQAAIDHIINDVKTFVRENGRALTSTNLNNTLKNWSRDDEKIKTAFSKVVIRRKH